MALSTTAFNKGAATLTALVSAILLLASFALADDRTDAIAERIAPVSNVCMAGEDCPTAHGVAVAGGASSAAASGPRDAETIYNTSCFACHAGAIPTSPKLGDVEAWAPRVAKGVDALYESALVGTAGGMPPRGACNNCSDDEIKAAVDYMVEQLK